ncbi:MAG TPA: pyridoxal phosphate-dependent aminotransferase [Polyangiales bacterium]
MFSKRSAFEQRKNALTLALEAQRPAYDLTESNPTRAALPKPGPELLAAFDNAAAAVYAPDPRGSSAARAAIAQRMAAQGSPVDPQHVFLTSGTSEAYGHLFKLLCDPEDEVLIPQPSYPLFEHLCRLENVRAVPYPLHYDGQWHMGLAELRAAITARTRAVLIVSPNNPTGSYLAHSELRALENLGLPIIADEVFAEYPLREGKERAGSALRSERALVFALYGLSKQAALPQWKVSWICMRGPRAQTEPAAARLELIADTYLSVATPTQAALPRLLELMAPTQAALHARLKRNLGKLRGLLSNGSVSPASLLDVEGGFYATLRLPRTQSEERWVLDFLEKDSVHVQPGYFFDFPDEAYVVLSLLTPEATFDEGVRRLLQRVERNVSSAPR